MSATLIGIGTQAVRGSRPPRVYVFGNPENRLIDYFLTRPNVTTITGNRIMSEIPKGAGKVPAEPFLRVRLIDTFELMDNPNVAEEVTLQVDCYGGPKSRAHDLAEAVRGEMQRLVNDPSRRDEQFRRVQTRKQYLVDETFEPPRPRYIVEALMNQRATVALV